MHRLLLLFNVLVLAVSCNPRLGNGLRKNDRRRDVEIITDKGTMLVRLSDSTPQHRDNFLKLVKQGFYDSILFHRVIRNFMVQAGDPNSKTARPGQDLGDGGPEYTVPAEFRTTLFHKKGVIAAARSADAVNPARASSGAQFYIVQGRVFSEVSLDSVERFRLKGRRLPEAHRTVYKTLGGAPHLDQNYTIFGEVIKGLHVIDSIGNIPTSGREGGDRPLQDVRIIKARLVKRK